MNDIMEILEHIKGQEKALTGLMEAEAEHISKALKRKNLTTAAMVTLNENLVMILDRLNELSNTTKEKYAMLMPHTDQGQGEDCNANQRETENCNRDGIYDGDSIDERNCENDRRDDYCAYCQDSIESKNAQMQCFDCNQCYENYYGCNYHPKNCFSKCSMTIMRF